MVILFKVFYKIKFLIVKIIRLFFSYLNGGVNCIICGNTTFIYPVCRTCIKNYFSIDAKSLENRCEHCGRELISTKHFCTKCREASILKNTDYIFPLFSYRLWNKELLFLWKIKEVRNLSFLFSSFVNKALLLLNSEFIVPVPPRKGKIRKKGWDQINELCNILEIFYNYKVLKLLKRLSSEEQKKLNRQERLETIKNAYILESQKQLNKELKKNKGIIPEKICLIDDVCTTGSTIECCSKILKEAGVREINVITLFIVD